MAIEPPCCRAITDVLRDVCAQQSDFPDRMPDVLARGYNTICTVDPHSRLAPSPIGGNHLVRTSNLTAEARQAQAKAKIGHMLRQRQQRQQHIAQVMQQRQRQQLQRQQAVAAGAAEQQALHAALLKQVSALNSPLWMCAPGVHLGVL